ncbi:SIR2 family protein [Pseudomonas sp. GM48]|uniref:SIR2 family protein n=1 Tax=Pseudomonas sp. GM48 TaxID=1144330 RepID=UPI0002F9DD94|nr:SIR2 family protein [Pseudomonas sp. GM48]
MSKIQSENVKAAWKYICQLRSQTKKNRASLILGAGISRDLHLPLWDKLLEAIKNEITTKIPEAAAVTEQPGKAALILFEMFSSYRKLEIAQHPEYNNTYLIEKKVLSDWRELIHKFLYANTTELERRKLIEQHPYFREMIEFIKNSEITVNYNFDDFVEFGLSQPDWNPSHHERPYQTIWSHQSQFTKNKSVIYHPNGFLPFDSKKFQSENLVFSDGSFADQLLEGLTGNLSTLLHVLTKKTSILIGHSLTDSTLLHLLRKATTISPGNYNYFIRFTAPGEHIANKNSIFEANFNNYNLITLFLNSSEIKEFLSAITLEERDFIEISENLGLPTKYIYYLVGSIGIGKSTALSQFGSLTTLDEWFDERPSDMALSPQELSTHTTITIDDWTNQQFGKKNNYLRSKPVGVFLVDRSPLDPLSFVVKVDEKERARSMISNGISPGQSRRKVEQGEIIHMLGDPKEIWSRLITKRKEYSWPVTKVEELQEKSKQLYASLNPKFIYSTQRKELDVIRDVAKIIFSQSYEPADLDAKLGEIAANDQ